jgi:ubiquinone/menaquinone biosynthesis C-methylase UbiE
VELDDFRRASHDVWERMAPGWDERRDWVWEASRAVGEWMVARLDPQPGQTVLELAAGAGDTGFAACAGLGGSGRLISTDFSARMVDAARRRAAELGVENAEFRELDAERMDLPEDSVDGVLCRWGYMLMADPAAALAETRRVLRPGGRLAFAVFAPSERNPFAAVPAGVLVQRGAMRAPVPGTPGICALGDVERLESLVTGAGFQPPAIEEVEFHWRFADFDDYWEFLNGLAGAIAMSLETLPTTEREVAREEIEDAIEEFRADDGTYEMTGVCVCAVTS